MQPDDLFKAFGDIADRHIDDRPIEDIPKKKCVPVWIKLVSVAASLVLIALVGVNVFREGASPADIVYPSANLKAIYMEHYEMFDGIHYYSYAELAENAEAIIVADVKDVLLEHAEEYDENVFNCFANVSICEVIKGDFSVGDSIYVIDNGLVSQDASENTIALTYSGGPLMEKGNRVLLFIKPHKTNTLQTGEKFYTFLSVFLGAFFLDEDGKYHEVSCYAEREPETVLNPTKLEDYEPKTLEKIKQLIVE